MKCYVLQQNIWAPRGILWVPQATELLLGKSLRMVFHWTVT